MDDSLYDEFGNFIGTVDSDNESQASQDDLDARADAYLNDVEDDEEEQAPQGQSEQMQVDGMSSSVPGLTFRNTLNRNNTP